MKKALITGLTGQDGSYLAELLLNKNYEVHGIIRRSSSINTVRIDGIIDNKKLHTYYGDITDSTSLSRLIERIKPDEIYNLGAQSHVKVSFEIPDYTTQVDALGTLRFLDSIKKVGINTKFYQASTSELYGNVETYPQSESTKFHPSSPYAAAKLYSYWILKIYREAYNIFACNGILFNHESPRRGETFITRKVTIAAAKIKLGMQETLEVGNIYSIRDWGYAPEFVEGMWKIMQQEKPNDYVLATGQAHSVKEFIDYVFKYLDMELEWVIENKHEIAIQKSNGKKRVLINPNYFRPNEVHKLIGDSSKAKKAFGWDPKTNFIKLIEIMVDHDLNSLKINK